MDRSLDEFTTADARADGTADETATEDDATPDGGATEDGTGGPSLTVRPATSTMDWTPGGATCASCGATVERRWRDDGRLVCLDCKQW